jgi:hypothetical protein
VCSANKNTPEFRQDYTSENTTNSRGRSANLGNDAQDEAANPRADLNQTMDDAMSSDSDADQLNPDVGDLPVLYYNLVCLFIPIFVMFYYWFFKQEEPEFPIIMCQETLMPTVTVDELDRANLAIELNISDAKIEAVVAYADRRAR